MKGSFFALISGALLFVACGTKEETTTTPPKTAPVEEKAEPMLFPFGLDFEAFDWTGHSEGCGGDCCHMADVYEMGQYTVISDTFDCWEYNKDYIHYFFDGERLVAVHQFSKSMYELEINHYKHTLYERTIDFVAEKTFERYDTVPSDFKGEIRTEFQEVEFDASMAKKFREQVRDPRQVIAFKPKDIQVLGDLREPGKERDIYFFDPYDHDEGFVITNANNYVEITDYSSRGIPKDAIFAFSTWWAGGGDVFYGVLQKGILKIYQRWEEEMAETDDVFKLYTELDPNVHAHRPDHYIVFKENTGKKRVIVAFNDKDEAQYMKLEGETYQKALVARNKNVGDSMDKTYYDVLIQGVPKETCSITHEGNWDYLSYQTKDGKMLNFTIDHEASVIDGMYRSLPLF